MGNAKSLLPSHDENHEKFAEKFSVNHSQMLLQSKIAIPLQVMVAHFTPSSFPMIPTVNPQSSQLCTDSWSKIVGHVVPTSDGNSISGMTAFYNEFYERLKTFDTSGKFDAVLSRHSGGQNQIAAKGAIILRIVKFVVRIDVNSKQNDMLLYMLGKSHSQKAIRPWQYAIFVQCLLNTISSRLGTDATSDVMEAWVNLFAYVMKGMLPPAIKGQVVETELNINTSSELGDGNIDGQTWRKVHGHQSLDSIDPTASGNVSPAPTVGSQSQYSNESTGTVGSFKIKPQSATINSRGIHHRAQSQ
jgi:hemoglobin-like flavoprotein